jgi:prepilin-type N-terminal cleavage/methylation domain-containing protein
MNRGFSLVELLLAIFILGIGVIGIAALFPAGISQQRQSADDMIGPMVAENAMAILRSKVRPEDFGTFEEFSPLPLLAYLRAPRFSIDGDFPWLRPGVLLEDNPSTNDIDERGMLDIFSGLWTQGLSVAGATEFPASSGYIDPFGTQSAPSLYGIPYNLAQPRLAVVTRQERYYPAESQCSTSGVQSPQFYWDCMFRRFNGRIYVAIFVYRVSTAMERVEWTMPANPIDPNLPSLPHRLDLMLANDVSSQEGAWDAFGPDANLVTGDDNRIVLGNQAGDPYDPADPVQAWQEPGQWILDQNNSMHRVLSSGLYDRSAGVFVDANGVPTHHAVELLRAVPQVPVGINGFDNSTNPLYFVNLNPPTGAVGVEDVVNDIWYMPLEIDLDVDDPLNGPDVSLTLTPVYLMVQEL